MWSERAARRLAMMARLADDVPLAATAAEIEDIALSRALFASARNCSCTPRAWPGLVQKPAATTDIVIRALNHASGPVYRRRQSAGPRPRTSSQALLGVLPASATACWNT
jgi:hypothetical protein